MSKYVGFRLGKVHESHAISEYYCGGCGWPVTDHDSFCPECGGAFRECDASNLEAENAKLREQVTRLQADWESERDYADQMEAKEKMAVAENAKLRELVLIMHSEMVSCEDNGYICGGHKFDKRVSEMGVEVDG